MDRTLFRVPGMDCAAEEAVVRMKLDAVGAVRALEVNLADRELVVFHDGDLRALERALRDLNLGSSLLATTKTEAAAVVQTEQRTLLWTVLIINAAFFLLEATAGVVAGSMGLVADSLDMLADALVYGLSLLAVGTTVARKKQVAKWSGYIQLTLAALGLLEVVRRVLGLEALPDYGTMIVVSALALVANLTCLYLLQRSRSGEAHMKASMIFTSNDVVINLGVIAAGLLVGWLDSGLPDLVVGAAVFLIVTRGALRILSLAR